jgi:phosphatidylglycerophosphate synthase
MDDTAVPGQHKHSASFLSALDRRLIARVVPLVPRWIHSHHLTMLTLLWSALILACDALAANNRTWLFAVSVFIAIQYVTDAVDGKLGVLRGDGLVRWGFYMDHLLDYIFLCSVLLGYTVLVPSELQWLMMAILIVAIGFMVTSFLACAVEGNLGISYLRLGPVEIRLLFIGINVWLALGGRAPLPTVLPLVLTVALATLYGYVDATQRRLWHHDTRQSSTQSAITNHQFNRQSPIVNRQSVSRSIR